MATATSLPAAFVANTVLTAAQQNDLRGAFRVLQFFSVQGATQQTSVTTTYADITSLTVTITPQSATNKILLISTNNLLASSVASTAGIRMLRDATNIFTSIQGYFLADSGASVTSIFLDSPASTSAITYKVQFNRSAGTGTVYSNLSPALSNFVVMEISA